MQNHLRYNRKKFKETLDIYQSELKDGLPFVWKPELTLESNLEKYILSRGFKNYKELYNWSIEHKGEFWESVIKDVLKVPFHDKPKAILSNEEDPENVAWLSGASMNIIDACFKANPKKIALIGASETQRPVRTVTYGELNEFSDQIAAGLLKQGYQKGDRIALFMPLNLDSVASYLGIIKAGLVVVSVADSFSSEELQNRLTIADCHSVITSPGYSYNNKWINLYAKVKETGVKKIYVFGFPPEMRSEDKHMSDILTKATFDAKPCAPTDTINILFSSGTTKEPKAIPWDHTTPIKCAMDGHFHQDIREDDVVTWTTAMGWMMTPWLIFAGLMNNATIALYTGAMSTKTYASFLEDHKISILGTIPSLVKHWRKSGYLEKKDLKIRLFSSTGEPSDAEDYLYLMWLMDCNAPIIEYCGGTEIGGGYITGSVLQPCSPSAFTTPALGIEFYLIDDNHKIGDDGEVFIVPPSLGLSQKLLNKDHHQEYYENMPKGPNDKLLRKHGDAFQRIKKEGFTFYKSKGRTDDSMNIGGIKISAVEIESVVNLHPNVLESAAVANQKAGPSTLEIHVILKKKEDGLKAELQQLINDKLNPLFKIAKVHIDDILPRTASGKMMRRKLK